MAISLGSNISSLLAQRKLGNASDATSRIFEKLSSGLRITRASDDAAGLAIADDLNSKSRVFTRAMLNANEGLSVLAIADSALSSLTEIVTRMRELSTQAANGAYSTTQRKAIDTEAQALAKEYFRISRSASFNRMNLFDGSLSDGLRLQVGYGTDGSIHSNIGGKLGTGVISSSATYGTETTISNDVALGDLNGDGILDMVTVGTNGPGGVFTVRLGDGTGSFGQAVSYSTSTSAPTSIALGDMNGDGVLDLVMGATDGGTTSVLVSFGSGNGTFGSVTTYALTGGSNPAVTLGDINGDGNLDVIHANGSSSVNVLLGSASGSLTAGSAFNTGANAVYELTLADMNNDGILDLITTGDGGGRNLGYVRVSLGTGSGTFTAGVSYSTTSNANYAVSTGDLNGDGILDIVIAGNNGVGAGTSSVLLGAGGGTYGTAVTYATETSTSNDVMLGDLNGDGVLDLITGGTSGADGYTTVRLGTGTGTFGAATSYLANTASTQGLAGGDINGDGVFDIITAGQSDGTSGSAIAWLGSTRDGISPILPFSLKTKADALQSMGMIDRTLANLSQQRGVVGAFQSRINVAINTLQSSKDSFKAAESRIRDVDIAEASSELVRTQILQQAATAVLAQANQLPRLALQLLAP